MEGAKLRMRRPRRVYSIVQVLMFGRLIGTAQESGGGTCIDLDDE